MRRYLVVIPDPNGGEPWEIHRCESMPEAMHVAAVLGAAGCPVVGIAEIEIDVDATIASMEAMLTE